MTRMYCILGFICALLLSTSEAKANPPCPKSAESLQAFASCLLPMANGAGMVLRPTAIGDLGEDHGALMAVMNRSSYVPLQTISASAVYYPVPIYRAASPYMGVFYPMGYGAPAYNIYTR